MRLFPVVFALAVAGCYHPSIKDGTIFCSDDSTPRCPSGLSCAADGLCYAKPPMTQGSPYGDGHLGKEDLTGQTGVLVLHTNTGEITLHDDTTNSDTTVTPASTGPFGTPQVNGPPVALWSFTELTIPAGMEVRLSSDSVALPALAATVSLIMNGTADFTGSGGQNGGASGNGVNPYQQAGGGGGAAQASSGGGGGGGHASSGTAGMGGGGGAAGSEYGSGLLPALFGAGGGGGGAADSGAEPGFGGTGGGAIVLLGLMVDVEGTIDVSGAAGRTASAGDAGGGGGGAGGTILISGDTVSIGASAVLTALGGPGGAASGSGGKGGDGAPGVVQLSSGTLNNAGATMPMARRGDSALSAFPR